MIHYTPCKSSAARVSIASVDNPFPMIDPPAPEEPSVESLIGVPLANVIYFPRLITKPKDITARRMVEKGHYVYEAIGGDHAFAQWALANRTKFYTTYYARMLPQGSSPVLQDHSAITFRLSVPVKSLDITDVEEIRSEGAGDAPPPVDPPHA
jgi:hypothetical protein